MNGPAELPLALDAMGGDHAPREVVRGGVEYARATGRPVVLVGRPEAIEGALRECVLDRARLEIVPAADVIDFQEKISRKVLFGKESSLLVGARLVREGRARAFVSAGHTGAMMAISKVVFGLLDGVDRPALPATLPRVGGGITVLLDVGANVDCKPENLRQFAVMGEIYARLVHGVSAPKVALLSIGEEDTKGNEIGREVARILRETPVQFVGNVEGNDLLTDKADVVVCDGFVGNVALKVAEGVAEAITGLLKTEMTRYPWRKPVGLLVRRYLRPQLKRLDYEEIGGVPLLGLRQVSVVAHGRSNAKAVRNALAAADAAASSGMIDRMAREIAVLHEAEQRVAERVAP